MPGRTLPAQEQGARPEGPPVASARSGDPEAARGDRQGPPEPGRHRRALREDPHLQLPAEPSHRPSRQRHDSPPSGDPRGGSRSAHRADRRPLPGRGPEGRGARLSLAVSSLIAEGRAALAAAGVPEPARDAGVLLGRVLSVDAASLHARPERPVEETAAESYRTLIARRAAREPLQYLTGVQEFWSLEFQVNPAVL